MIGKGKPPAEFIDDEWFRDVVDADLAPLFVGADHEFKDDELFHYVVDAEGHNSREIC